MNKTKVETTLAIVSFATICFIYFFLIPGQNGIPALLVYRGLIYAIFSILLPIILFGVRDYAEMYGYRSTGLIRSALIGGALAPVLFALGYFVVSGPVPPLLGWYFLNVLEETYFRGLWQRVGGRLAGPWGAVLIPSILFGVYHLTLGFSLLQAIGPVIFGLLAGWLRKDTDNILGPILLHMALATGVWLAAL